MFGEKDELKQGVANAEVASLQKTLVNMGYDVGGVDGKYGPKTVEAVERFQDDHNLKIDGVVGASTGAAVDHYYKMKLEELAAEQEKVAEIKPVKQISFGTSAKSISAGEKTASSSSVAATPATKPTKGPQMMKSGLMTSMKPKKK